MDKRNGYPSAWSCLDDEQREIIHDWYERVRESDAKEWEREKRIIRGAGYFAMLPFATFVAWGHMDGTWLEFIISFFVGFIVCGFVFFLLSDAYYYLNYMKKSKPPSVIDVVFQCVVAVFISMCILAII